MSFSNTDTETNFEQRFGHLNPPPSIAVAEERLEDLEVQNESVGAQLEFKVPADFRTDGEYIGWQKRAIGALSYIRAELKFLEKWLKAELAKKPQPKLQSVKSPPVVKKPEPPVVQPTVKKEAEKALTDEVIGFHVEQFRVYVQAFAEEMERRYKCEYNSETDPQGVMDALRRVLALKQQMRECQTVFEDVNAKAATFGISNNDLAKAKKSLVKISEVILVEVRFLKTWLNEQGSGYGVDKILKQLIVLLAESKVVVSEEITLMLEIHKLDHSNHELPL